jgi:ribosomal protein S18 acetylase RimI-like enzyme
MPELIYCAAGNKRFAEIAIKHGFRYGAQLPNTVYNSPYFVDQDWKNPVFDDYINALDIHRPDLATVLDWEYDEQFSEVIRWAEAAAPFVKTIIIIPKVMGGIDRIPRTIKGKPVRLGYSVPTSYAGTQLPTWEFNGWDVHLLGGSPKEQLKLSHYMNVASADGNYAQKMAIKFNQFFVGGTAHWANNRWWPKLQESKLGHIGNDAIYLAFELSCINIRALWHGCTATIRFAVIDDIPKIKKIANQYKNELGYVMIPNLKRAIQKSELYVAEYGHQIVGFCNWHRRRDGWSTIYEIAVDRARTGEHIGRALLEAVPSPRQLKCTIDNLSANQFYEHVGMILTGIDPGRKRLLNIWKTYTGE